MHYSVLMHLLHDNTDAYATRQGNDHYVYHNVVVMVVSDINNY